MAHMPSSPVRVWIIAGQSNAEGKGNTANLTGSLASYATPYADVQYAYEIAAPTSGAGGPATVIRTWGNLEARDSGLFGVELSAGRRLLERFAGTVRIIKCATTATALYQDWDSTTTDFGSGPTGLWSYLNTFVDARMAEQPLRARIAGLMWVQGNSDASALIASQDYAENLGFMIYRLREKYGHFPVVIDKLHASNTYTYLANVRAEQVALASIMRDIYLVDADDLTLGDGVHYDEVALLQLGYRMADAFPNGSTAPNILPTSDFTYDINGQEVTFTDNSYDLDGTISAWSWNFGDSTTSTSQNPVKTYGSVAEFTVSLTVTDNDGGQHTAQKDVDLTTGVPTDGASPVYVPQSSAHFTALDIAVPDSLWLCQESSGNLADSIGAVALTANGSPLYRQTITGWTRKAVGFDEGSVQSFRIASGTYTPVANSFAFLAYQGFDIPAASRQLARGTDGAVAMGLTVPSNGRIRLSINGVNSDSGQFYHSSGGVTIRPLLVVYDRNASTVKVHTNLEEWSGTFADITADGWKGFGAVASGQSPLSGRIVWAAWWHGANAAGLNKTVLTKLGWSLPY